jgi:hypothetical protein
MLNCEGSWKEWSADPAAREALKNSILYGYYFFYSVIFTFCFLIIPANFFYHGLSTTIDEDGEEVNKNFLYIFLYNIHAPPNK